MSTQANPLFAACTSFVANLTLTENGDLTNVSSQDALVDFFFKIIDRSEEVDVRSFLTLAWQSNAKDALKLIFYLLDVRDGKACTKPALYALLWLHEHHPKTFLANIQHLINFGCIRDLPTLLMMIRCKFASEINYQDWQIQKCKKVQRKFDHDAFYKKVRNVSLSNEAVEVHQAVVRIFVDALLLDKLQMDKSKPVSLFSKWLPSQDSYLNRTTNLFDDVAVEIYNKDHHSVRRRPLVHARNYLRKTYIGPLRNHSQVVERLMSDKRWNEISYPRVPSVCMLRNAEHFKKHDDDRYSGYLKGAAAGEVKINVSALKPNEICFPSRKVATALPPDLANAQWEAYVARMEESGALNNAVAICDVSGSMSGEPMNVAISLGLLVATLAEAPWKNHLITFSEKPSFHVVQGTTLNEKIADIAKTMYWGYNTNFDRVFDLILARATRFSLKAEAMPKMLFVFSDMQFDEADQSMTSTAYERIKKKFAASGYEMPQIVFWNLRNSFGVPVTITDEGTALIGGFSGNLLKIFLEGANFEEEWEMVKNTPKMTPIDTMRKAIDHERFNVLRVVD